MKHKKKRNTRSLVNRRTIAKFMGMKYCSRQIKDWNFVMLLVSKIEAIIGHSIDISDPIKIAWWYSPKKTGTFSKGAGGGGGHTVARQPFEAIFGKFYQITVYSMKGRNFKIKKNELAPSKIEATLIGCSRWIFWYNKIVLKNKANKQG